MAVAAVLAAGLIACGTSDDDEEGRVATTADDSTDQWSETDSGVAKVQLETRGAPDGRVIIRPVVEVGDVYVLEMTLDQQIEISGLPPERSPVLATQVRSEVIEIGADGSTTLSDTITEFLVVDPGSFGDEQLAELESTMEVMTRVETVTTWSADGETDVEIEVPAGVDPAVADAMDTGGNTVEQLGFAFPRGPVGVGARWRVDAVDPDVGSTVTAGYEIVEIDDDVIRLGLTTSVEFSGVDGSFEGTGESEFRVGSLYPTTAVSELSGTLVDPSSGAEFSQSVLVESRLLEPVPD